MPLFSKSEKQGLWPLKNKDPNDENCIDIFAIHGLGGDKYRTWTDNGKLWLRDLLPAQLPEARIFTYGYDSTVAFSKSSADVDDFARNFLHRVNLARKAQAEKTRRMIFICHSLGGLLFKQALVICNKDPYYKHLLDKFFGVVFMGTPHGGSDIAFWASYAGNLVNAVSLGTRTNKELLGVLRRDSAFLGSLSQKFLVQSRFMQILSFYETEKFPMMNCRNMNRETLSDWPSQADLTAEDIDMMSSVGGDSAQVFQFNDYNPSLRYLPNTDIAAFTQFDIGESGYHFNGTISDNGGHNYHETSVCGYNSTHIAGPPEVQAAVTPDRWINKPASVTPTNCHRLSHQGAQLESLAMDAGTGAWGRGSMASSLATLTDFPCLSLDSGESRDMSVSSLKRSSQKPVFSHAAIPPKRRSPHGSSSISHTSARSKKTRTGYRKQTSSGNGFPFTENSPDSDKANSSNVEPQRAITLLEESFQGFSTYSKRKAAVLLRQLKQLIHDEKLYGNLNDDSNDINSTSINSSLQDSLSTSEVTDSEYRTDNTSVSCTPRPQTNDTQDGIPMDLKPIHKPCTLCGAKPVYYCTRKDCSYSVHSFTDWKRHEEGEKHWPKERFMCLQCPTGQTANSVCEFCHVPFSSLGCDAREHYLRCATAKDKGKTFGRKDHLVEHLQKEHGMSNMGLLAATWKYAVNSKWPRQCGFCGERLQTWDQRMEHIAKHYKDGLNISSWKLPFPRSKDLQPRGLYFHPKDDSSDNDDDSDESKGPSHRTIVPRQTSTRPAGDNHTQGRPSSRGNGSSYHSEQRRRQEGFKDHKATHLLKLTKPSLTLERYLKDTEESIPAVLNLGNSSPSSNFSLQIDGFHLNPQTLDILEDISMSTESMSKRPQIINPPFHSTSKAQRPMPPEFDSKELFPQRDLKCYTKLVLAMAPVTPLNLIHIFSLFCPYMPAELKASSSALDNTVSTNGTALWKRIEWDWSTHWQEMLELCNSGYSIYYNYEAIQREGFMPSQRAMYDRFLKAAFPADCSRGLRPNYIGFQIQMSAIDTSSLNEFIIARMLEDTLPIECDQETSAPKLSWVQSAVTTPQDLAQDCMDGVQLPLRLRKQDAPEYPQIATSRKPRETKWNWQPHIRKLLDLYFEGDSIPDIHKKIQCESFRPCQRAVYDKFKEMGLSTSHDRGTRNDMSETGCVQILEDTAISREGKVDSASRAPGLQNTVTTPRPLSSKHLSISTLPVRQRMPLILEEPQVDAVLKAPNYEEASPQVDVGGNPQGRACVNDCPADGSPNPKKRGKKEKPARAKEPDLTREKDDILTGKLIEYGLYSKPETDYERMIHRAGGSSPLKRLRRLLHIGPQSADSSSEYLTLASFSTGSSGRQSSIFSRTSRPESVMTQAESVISDWEVSSGAWNHRLIQCTQSHDYGSPSQHHDFLPCRKCGFSKVHNLAVFASCLPIAEFKAEIDLMSLLELQVVDAAGNTALHYTAAAGASVAHLKALIDAGIPYSCQNTGKQNFLHCLQPVKFRSQSCNQDCFEIGLDQLLNSLDPKSVFNHQDNNGQTVIRALASHINNSLCRQSIFDLFKKLDLGLLINTIDRSGQSAKTIWPPDYQNDTDLCGSDTFKTLGNVTPEWNGSPIEKAHENIKEAYKDPFYIDRLTKDNALHSLARVNTHGDTRRYLIADLLKFFVSSGLSLNHHNREGHHPLSAFICYQYMRSENDDDETGATTARFLKIMLSKTGQLGSRDDLNNINVDMMNRRGATALHEAACRGQWECVKLLIEAGANVNARLNDNPNGCSILAATRESLQDARIREDVFLKKKLQNVLRILRCAKAFENPSSLQQRGTVSYN